MSERPSVLRPVLIGVVILLLPVLLWIASLLYWHFRIRRAIRAWEVQCAVPTENYSYHDIVALRSKSDELHDAGCRALPYLVESLNATADPRVQQHAMYRILEFVTPMHGDAHELWGLNPSRPADERQKLISNFNQWWRVNGGLLHQWWRTWSNHCYE